MKKIICLLLALLVLLACTACGAESDGSENLEGSVEELLGRVTKDVTDPEMSLVTAEATEENFSWYFFIDPIPGAEAWVSEPMIGSIPHFVGLLRVPEGTDPEETRSQIEEKLDPRKWICVEAEKAEVLRRGDLILVVMSDSDAAAKAAANFRALR